MKWVLVCVCLLGLACGKAKPTAQTVCAQLATSGVAANCKDGGPAGGLGSAASEYVVFDLPSVPGETGQVLRFEKPSDYAATVKAFDAAAVLAGRHRYGSESALIFVQLNSKASSDVGAKADAIVKGL
ncbi:MAG TPA: hypothetical protein VGM29_10400 [Polyangiaceae bacterium]|jgi:hypothetical protein